MPVAVRGFFGSSGSILISMATFQQLLNQCFIDGLGYFVQETGTQILGRNQLAVDGVYKVPVSCGAKHDWQRDETFGEGGGELRDTWMS